MKRLLNLSGMFVIVLLAGCQTEPVVSENNPMIRTLSAAIVNSPLDVCVNDELSIEDIGTGARTDHVEADPQKFDMATGATGTPCDETTPITGLENIQLTADVFSTVVILPDGVSAIQIIDDTTMLSAGQGRIRVINMSEDSGSVSVVIENGDELFSDVGFNDAGTFGYIDIDAGTYNLILIPSADESMSKISEDFEIKEGTTYTVFFTGRIDGVGTEFRVGVYEDVEVGVVTPAS